MSLFDGFFDLISGGAESRSRQAMDQALGEFGNVKAPTLDDLRVQYETLSSQGQMTPELEQAFQQQASELQNISTDPRLKQAQMNALSQLSNIADSGGMTLQDQSNLARMQTQVGAQERGSREAILQQMARRGASGSGVELAAMLANQQGSAERAAQGGLDVAAQAQQRALDAIMQSGQLGGQIRGQEFQEQSSKAQAQDAINRFNVANRQQVEGANVQRRNDAQQTNLMERQRIADQNTGIRNTQQQQNVGNRQTVFDNSMSIAGARSGVYQNQANQAAQEAQSRRQFIGGLISSGAQAAATGGKGGGVKK